MRVEVSVSGRKVDYEVSPRRIEKLIGPDDKLAVSMGLWDKFKDLFRAEKKSDVLAALRKLIYGGGKKGAQGVWLGEIAAFNRLKACSGDAYKDRFQYCVNDKQKVEFMIDGHVICKKAISEIVGHFSVNGVGLLDNYEAILARSGAAQGRGDGPGVACENELLERACAFYAANPVLKNVLKFFGFGREPMPTPFVGGGVIQ
ncbi:hypothetical protein [Pseudomonas sp. MWU13-3659]|uniref:hypothetical protein n=1 Tax=Pseudomonas sp. MWU13-3659 TaxID=2986964 RepID=UPI0020760BE5|nr:hypothetical protein [Pseudomonas sp. MWU13-3659]